MLFDLLLLLYLVAILPKLLFDHLILGKRHPALLQRLGANLPDPQGKKTIWIHAVSVGEVKAAQPLFHRLRKLYPHAFFLITTTTSTGQTEARRTLPEADAFRYLPLDFTWNVRRFARHLRPQLFLSIESDFWPNLLAAIQQSGGKTALVSGKLSERSARRFQRLSLLVRPLFARYDLLCVQNEEQKNLFLPLVSDPSRLHITGNLKQDMQPQPTFPFTQFRRPAITISCTHSPEEEQLLKELIPLNIFIFLAPRHPERFNEVEELLRKSQISYSRWSDASQKKGSEKVLLVDAMGQLPNCYAASQLAIVGGSFTPRVGGHNVLEPCLYGTPVFFGPYMFSQRDLTGRVLEAKAGRQLSLSSLRSAVEAFFKKDHQTMHLAAKKLIEQGSMVTSSTLSYIATLMPNQ